MGAARVISLDGTERHPCTWLHDGVQGQCVHVGAMWEPCGHCVVCSIYSLPACPFSNLMSRGLRPADHTLQTDQQKKTKRTHRVRKLSGICLEVVLNKSLINPHLIHTCAHSPPTHTQSSHASLYSASHSLSPLLSSSLNIDDG